MWRAKMKDLKEYLALPYSIEILPDEEGYVATIPDLPGCMSSGETIDAALGGLEEAKELWLQGRIEAGEEIPEPVRIEDFSGKFVLRIPRSLHRSLDREARKQGVSLNQYVLHILSERHRFGALQDKVELALDELAETGESRGPDWLEPQRYRHVRLLVSGTTMETTGSQLLGVIRTPTKSYSGRQRVRKCGEFTHGHR
jgi:predicted RNase H-like HicB family nuclease